ncbi:REP element-mobilizing transposase RayT [Thioalbus denitrificans]|uniref:REP element-mobilizing transposase RayT n=2 Tax=Thioalbus denitrificans TaxID=547122 RepID=A0A369CGN5_9GAMM|nr:REP element-mobilizing transposase RayT [Thioalbus denitrificans]
MMNPRPGHAALRRGRVPISRQPYLITTTTRGRRPFLAQPGAAGIVLECLGWLDGKGRMQLDAAVVMPDHVHFVATLANSELGNLMHSLKSFSANRINGVLEREGPLWARQYHEQAIRTEDGFTRAIQYVLNNPLRSGLVERLDDYPHWYCRYPLLPGV